ncbi:MAG: helix-turn-helix domain-containing protein [Treponema sp.]|jgi:AraC-like DNA-binding protein/ligand-binding sensor protein|nr:helix-turn-helix domain-containing protein [Treponema sp.]
MGDSKKTNPLLLKACRLVSEYAKATGTIACVLDHDYLPVPEMFGEITGDTNTCLYCLKYQTGSPKPEKAADLRSSPCNMFHINAVKESQLFGGSYIYMCALGFMFWTSPLYLNERFVGALLGSGFLAIDSEETAEALSGMSGGEVPAAEFKKHLSRFPRSDSERIKSLAELLMICAENLSVGERNYHEILKRRAEQQSSLSAEIRALKAKYPPGTEYPGYPLDKERMLLTALRQGDHKTARQFLNEILANFLFSNPDRFKHVQFRAIELIVLLSRSAAGPGNAGEDVLETNNQYLLRIQETQTIEELTDLLHSIVEHMADQIFSFQGVRHAAALRKADRYIRENYTRKTSLREIADASGLSAPYFSTIFREEMGENLSAYLNRLRVENACRLLTETDMSLSDIAGSCGFEDQSRFSKIFKHYTGLSPGKYRGQGGGRVTEISENNFSSDYRTIAEKQRPLKTDGTIEDEA